MAGRIARATVAGAGGGVKLPALTLWRPWPWAVFHGSKDIENRGWVPPASLLGRYMAIHAGKKFDRGAVGFVTRTAGIECPASEGDHPLGIIGIVRVVGWVRAAGASSMWRGARAAGHRHVEHSQRSPWLAAGGVGWVLEDPIALDEPIQCLGRQGLWQVNSDALDRMMRCDRVRAALEGGGR